MMRTSGPPSAETRASRGRARGAGAAIEPGRLLAAPADMVLRRVLDAVLARHPGLAARLAGLPPATLLIDPTDLPVRFLIRLGSGGPSLGWAAPGSAVHVSTRVRAPIGQLMALAEARIDADAIFFNRELTIDGEIEPVLALRNALESESVDIAGDILAALGPLEVPARHLASVAAGAAHIAGLAVERARAALLAPAMDRLEQIDRSLSQVASAVETAKGARRPPRQE